MPVYARLQVVCAPSYGSEEAAEFFKGKTSKVTSELRINFRNQMLWSSNTLHDKMTKEMSSTAEEGARKVLDNKNEDNFRALRKLNDNVNEIVAKWADRYRNDNE